MKNQTYGLTIASHNVSVYVTEGPFDSTFLQNAIAMCGADVDVGDWGISNPVWVYDTQPLNREIVQPISRTIERGDSAVIFSSNIREKDLNDIDIDMMLKK